jgi:hypothetical protein
LVIPEASGGLYLTPRDLDELSSEQDIELDPATIELDLPDPSESKE